MAKRFTKRKFKKRRVSRRRSFRKRRTPMPKYDGMIRIKMQATKEFVTTEGAPTKVSFFVQWGDQISGTQANVVNLLDCPEWVRYRDLYQAFSISGCKMHYMPYKFIRGTAPVTEQELLVGSSVTGEPISATNVRLAIDFKVKPAGQQLHKYVGVAKSRMRTSGGGLVTTGGSQRWLFTNSGQRYSEGVTLLEPEYQGLASGSAMGIIYVTYYVWFKSQRINT